MRLVQLRRVSKVVDDYKHLVQFLHFQLLGRLRDLALLLDDAHTAGVNVDGYTLTLAANPWNIVRTYNLTPGRELLFACRYRLGTASNFVAHMSEADNVYDPLYGSFVGDQGAWSTAKMYFTVPPNGVAKLHFGGAGPAQPDGWNGPPDSGRNPGDRQHGGGGGHGGFGAAAEARVPRRRGCWRARVRFGPSCWLASVLVFISLRS